MNPIRKEELCGRFCEYNDKNFTALSSEFKIGKNKRTLRKTLNIYITSDLEVCFTYLTSNELKKLNLQEIKLIDGFWYFKSDLK